LTFSSLKNNRLSFLSIIRRLADKKPTVLTDGGFFYFFQTNLTDAAVWSPTNGILGHISLSYL
jgi:hypothetical protein